MAEGLRSHGSDAAALGKDAASWPASALSHAFLFATDYLAVYVDEVNALNVYPVPDGDTGTNMHLTLQSVRRHLLETAPADMPALAHALSYGSLLGARGNSGVILSQVLKGFAEVLKGVRQLRSGDLAEALGSATKTAYAAVMKPVEGTILSVSKAISEEAAKRAAGQGADEAPLAMLRRAIAAGHEALQRTPEQLPILKQAGVVDAGGLGLLRLYEGMVAAFEGQDLPAPPEVTRRAQEGFEEEAFGFCTEFLLSDATATAQEIQRMVAPFGDSLLVVGAEGFIKGHIHTEEPEALLALVAKHGTMVKSKVEDMSEQHSEILSDLDMGAATAAKTGLVAVSSGYGMTKVFRSLGARVVGGGQTNNPSVQDIADAVRSLGAETVIVMPNNKNIILAAERVAELVPERQVRVLPTRTLGQGLAAAVHFSEDAGADALWPAMEQAAKAARTLEVTVASRDATIDGVEVRDGAFIGLVDGVLVHTAGSAEDCLLGMLDQLAEEAEVGTLFYTVATGEEAAGALLRRIATRFPNLELERHGGGPDLYPYLMVLE